MNRVRLVGLGVFLFFCAAHPIEGRWLTAASNKAPVELEQLSANDLFKEGFDVCAQRAFLARSDEESAKQTVAEATAYAETVAEVVRRRHGGNAPKWVTQLIAAKTTKECQTAFRTFVSAPQAAAKRGTEAAEVAPTQGVQALRTPVHRVLVPKPARPDGDPAEKKDRPRPSPTARPRRPSQLPPWLAPR